MRPHSRRFRGHDGDYSDGLLESDSGPVPIAARTAASDPRTPDFIDAARASRSGLRRPVPAFDVVVTFESASGRRAQVVFGRGMTARGGLGTLLASDDDAVTRPSPPASMEPQQPPLRRVGMRRLVGEPGDGAATAIMKERLRAFCSDEGAHEPEGNSATTTSLEDLRMTTSKPAPGGESEQPPNAVTAGSDVPLDTPTLFSW